MASLLLLTDRPAFEAAWRDACSRLGLSVRAAAAKHPAGVLQREPAVVIDAADGAHRFEELLGCVGFARSQGVVVAVALEDRHDPLHEDMLVELCGGLIARTLEDAERIAAAIRRRCDPERCARFAHVSPLPSGEELLAVFEGGHATLIGRPLGAEDRGAEIAQCRITEDGRCVTIQLQDGVVIELPATELAPPVASSRPPAATNGLAPTGSGDVDGVRLGQRLRALRLAAGLTQAELARRTGIHRPNIARVEAGRHTPSLETLARLAAAIGVSTTRVLAD